MSKKKVGFLCVNLKGWISLERTKFFYIESLKQNFDVFIIENEQELINQLRKFDILINFFGNLGWDNKKEIKIPVVFCLHGGATLNYKFLLENGQNINKSDSFIVNCKSDIAILEKVYRSPPEIYLVRLPVSKDIKLDCSKAECKSVLNIDNDTLLIGHVSRILPQKNLHQSIEVLNAIKKNISKNVKLLIVGDYWTDYPILNWTKKESDYYNHIRDLIKRFELVDNIIQFESNLSNEELSICYGALDFLSHPTNSLDENFGYAPIEAMKCGTPVIGTAYGGLKDSIIHEETGFLLNTWGTKSGIRSNYNSSLRYVKELTFNEHLKNKVSKNCLNRADKVYSYESCSANLVSTMNKAVKRIYSTTTMVGILDFLDYEENEYLPKIDISWNYYRKVAELYCNSSIEELVLTDNIYLETFSKFVINKNKICFLDPAWPITIPFNNKTKEILNICIEAKSLNQLRNKLSFILNNDIITELISVGALLFYKHQKE